ncbi:zinc-dependent metalloprotease [Myxococcus sp. CA056]|uniref:zinc-dependent metalloprotease n=1 Tax=Myxococcus sp. CA056 TaxID=2741740 RepID=UPI0020C64F50|nr:zinc-dependent metalloprotease [Myxococcus sp. CA056]
MRKQHFSTRRSWMGALALVAMLGVGCSEPQNTSDAPEAPGAAIVLGEDFVEVPRELTSEQHTQVTQKLDGVVDATGRTFYLAIRRSELKQRWFLSATLRQLNFDPEYYGLPANLIPRVIRFQEQNGKLYAFDARDGLTRNDLFKPDSLVEAYPIVTDHAPFNRLPGSDQYVLIDPAAGLNRVGILGDHWYAPGAIDFRMELLFSQRFRRLSDGVQYEQVFTGFTDVFDDRSDYLERNGFRASGTLAMALRKYKEGEGFTEMPAPEPRHYFRSEGRFIPNTGELALNAIKWNIRPGMKPIRFYITPNFLELNEDPRYRGADVVGAVKRGIEGWNAAFGFKVFEAVQGDSSMDIGEDDKNFAVLDPKVHAHLAIADFSSNPNTGEVRRATVMISAAMIHDAEAFFAGELTAFSAASARDESPRPRLYWVGLTREPSCELDAASLPSGFSARLSSEEDRSEGPALTVKQKVERYITYIMLHEVGHTLGLRHNFNGSRVYDGTPQTPRSSTVMDYSAMPDTIHVQAPGTYDVAAVRYLYGLSTALPTDLFCTDSDVLAWAEPACVHYDRYDDPLTRFHMPNMRTLAEQVLRGAPVGVDFRASLQALDSFVRGGDASGQAQAYDVLMEQVRPPLQIPSGEGAAYAVRANDLARRILSFLYLDTRVGQPHAVKPPPATPAYTQALLADVRGILLNVDGVRTFPVRRVMVNLLKAHQTLAAYGVLQEVHTELTARLPTLSGDERLGTMELLGRIEVARSPYFR